MSNHCVSTKYGFGIQSSKIHLSIDTDIFTIMVNDEIIKRIGTSVDINTIRPEFILTIDGLPYNNYYGMMCDNAEMYLGQTIDIECILRNFLSKHDLIIIPKTNKNIRSMCTIVGVNYEYWMSMYNNYTVYRDEYNLPYDKKFINVLEVFLYKQSSRP